MNRKVYTFRQVANQLGVNISTVWRWHLSGVRSKKLRSFLIGGRRWVSAEDLDQFLSHENCQATAPQAAESVQRRKIAERKLDSRRI